jgi:transposase
VRSASRHAFVRRDFYGYATGVFSSRKLERATYDSVAFRFIAANDHPDHDTIATFRRRFLEEIEGLFVQVLELAREMGMLKMGSVALDGAKDPCQCQSAQRAFV